MNHLKIVCSILVFFLSHFASAQSLPPKEVQADWENLTQDGGNWVADNAAYKNDNEPFEAYGLTWTWGFAKKSINGTLYGIQDGKKAGTFYEFKMFYHPKKNRIMYYQFGTDGTVGEGEIKLTGTHSEVLTTFFMPGGGTYKQRHEEDIKKGERHSSDFNLKSDGTWEKGRTYIWKIKL